MEEKILTEGLDQPKSGSEERVEEATTPIT